MTTEDTDLNPSQEKFIDEYLIDLNATRAYKATYPDASEESARRAGSRLLTNVDIKKVLSERLKESRELLEATRERILRELNIIAFSDIKDFVDWGSRPKFKRENLELDGDLSEEDIDHMERELEHYISFKAARDILENSKAISEISMNKYGIKIKFHDKVEALNKLIEYTKLMELVEDDGQSDLEWDHE